MLNPARRAELLQALRTGTVPERSLDALAVGLDRFVEALDAEMSFVAKGHGVFKAVRGEYGCGKTFLVRWLQERAMDQGFAASEVQISETETPLHRLETVYRRMMERLSTSAVRGGALASIIDGWFLQLETDVMAKGGVDPGDDEAVETAIGALMERRLLEITRRAPQFAAVLRAYHQASIEGDLVTAQGLLAWLAGQPNVGRSVKSGAGLKGDIDHFGALAFLQGVLVVLRDAGYSGLVFVLDEVETLQRMRSDTREKSLNALRQLSDEIAKGQFPGLYFIITGTPAFYDGPQGVQRAPALASRLHTDFDTEGRFDNPRAPQIRLIGFDRQQLEEVGRKVRDIFAHGARDPNRVRQRVDDNYIATLAEAVAGRFGGKVNVAPRLFLKKLVSDVLDRVDQFEDFDPRRDYALTVRSGELDEGERAVIESVDDIDIEL